MGVSASVVILVPTVPTKVQPIASNAVLVRLLLATATHTAHPVPQATLQLTASPV